MGMSLHESKGFIHLLLADTTLGFGADAALLEPEDLRLEIREERERSLACQGCISFLTLSYASKTGDFLLIESGTFNQEDRHKSFPRGRPSLLSATPPSRSEAALRAHRTRQHRL